MNPKQHSRLSELFQEAIELAPEKRDRFLRTACPGEPKLRAEVESLLRHHDNAPAFLGTDALRHARETPIPPPPKRVGSFEILHKLGEGGMGVVYLAEQHEPIHRRVAVKLIRLGLATEQVIARFESERQALALMEHPNIARVIDAGALPDGRPYFAMEYVDGEPITRYCDSHRLDLRRRLTLFRQVCNGVQHAHQNAIIHRDIKPSNVLVTTVDGRPEPKIIDFGVAKALGQGRGDGVTRTAVDQLIGTPEYMSPEQAEAHPAGIDTRTDVYSLGVLLYELIVGVRPLSETELRNRDVHAIRRLVIESEPPTPSYKLDNLGPDGEAIARDRGTDVRSLLKRLRGDLDWITLKATEKDRSRRYSSPAELADDVGRYLANEPILARPPSKLYRAVKFARKHRAAVGFGASLFVVLLVFATTTAVQNRRIASALELAQTEKATQEQVSNILIDMFDVPASARRFSGMAAEEVLRFGVTKIRDEFESQPLTRAKALHSLGTALRQTRSFHDALDVLEEAAASLTQLRGPSHPDTLAARSSLATVLADLQRHEEAEKLYLETLAAQRQVLSPDDPAIFRTIAGLGALYYYDEVREDKAKALLMEAREGLSATLGEAHHETLGVESLLGGLYLRLERPESSRKLLLGTLSRARVANDSETRVVLYNLAISHAATSPDRALDFLEESIRLGFHRGIPLSSETGFEPLLDDPRFRALERLARFNDRRYRELLIEKAAALAELNGHAQAESMLRELGDACRKLLGDDNEETQTALYRLGKLYWMTGRWDEALPLYRETVEWTRRTYGVDHYQYAFIQIESLQLDLAHGRRDSAVTEYERISEVLDASQNFSLAAYSRAAHAALTGAPGAALTHLRLAADRGFSNIELARKNPAFESLRGDTEFEAILARIDRNIPTAY